jgi:hypothetical protein
MISDPIEFELFKNSLFSIADEMALTGFVRITRWLGREVAGRLSRWPNSHTAATASRRLSYSMLCGCTFASR